MLFEHLYKFLVDNIFRLDSKKHDSDETIPKVVVNSCLCMVAALVFHFFGYECARSASISLLAGKVSAYKFLF